MARNATLTRQLPFPSSTSEFHNLRSKIILSIARGPIKAANISTLITPASQPDQSLTQASPDDIRDGLNEERKKRFNKLLVSDPFPTCGS